jgi:fibronectin-binding autotransporter adhesin
MITRRVSSPRPLSISLSRLSSALAIAAAVGVAGGTAKAANFTWDPTATGGITGGGTGTWDVTQPFWYNGTTDVPWPNLTDSIAIFGGGAAANTVTINTGTGVTANGLTFNLTGYTIAGNTAADVLTLAGTTPTITVNNGGATDTISTVVAGTAGLTKAGFGSLVLSGANTYDGLTTISNGKLSISNAAALGLGWSGHGG